MNPNIKKLFLTLSASYNLPQISALVGSICHGRQIEVCERDYKIRPCIFPYGPAIKRLFNFDPIKISASQADALAKLEAVACPFFGQVVMGEFLWCLSFFVKERRTRQQARKSQLWISTASQ